MLKFFLYRPIEFLEIRIFEVPREGIKMAKTKMPKPIFLMVVVCGIVLLTQSGCSNPVNDIKATYKKISGKSDGSGNDSLSLITGGRSSCNVEDIRFGVACATPGNCSAGNVGECDKTRCKQKYNTGNCDAICNGDGSITPSGLCKVIEQNCDPSICDCTEPTTTWLDDETCQFLDCTRRGPEVCDQQTCKAQTTNGRCTEYWSSDDCHWHEQCKIVEVQCYDPPNCSPTPIPTPTVRPTPTPATTPNGGSGDPHYNITVDGQTIVFTHHGINGHTYRLFAGNNISLNGIYVPTQNADAPQVIGVVIVKFSDASGIKPLSWDLAGKPSLGETTLELGFSQSFPGDGTVISYDAAGIHVTANNGTIVFQNHQNSFSFTEFGTFYKIDGILGEAINLRRGLSDNECAQFDITH